mmetsp:Transcript_28732/g.79112  ORF Transcript_28732/g.79112 Transcript_28732/m.79112 type:complete len:471 (+) Transcript_28732:208-1620(+)
MVMAPADEQKPMELIVGSSVNIKATGHVGVVTASNGHACKISGVWFHHDDLEAAEQKLWRIAAAAVWLEHLLLLTDSEDLPVTFALSRLSWWATRFLENALPQVAEELAMHCARISLATSSEDGASGGEEWVLTRDPVGGGGTRKLLADICAPICSMGIDWLATLARSISSIAEITIEALGDVMELSALRKVQVNYAVMFCEEWSTPYEVCWQADGAGNCITMPNVPNFVDRHFSHFARLCGHTSPGHTLLYEYLGTYVIPCHEVLHIVQHLHGEMRDPDPQSYAMEHDASRLNYVMLWHVLQRDASLPAWFRSVVMLEGMNRAITAHNRFSLKPTDKYAAYRKWADSFGLESPSVLYAEGTTEHEQLAFEGLSKILVAGEALTCRGGGAPTFQHLVDLLRVAFSPSRRGDVYSAENRAVVNSALPTDLRLDATAGRMLSAPAGLSAQDLEQLRAALSAACTQPAGVDAS